MLALDDYHVIDAPDIHESVTFLLGHLPPQVTIAITTRADPPLPLVRLRGRGAAAGRPVGPRPYRRRGRCGGWPASSTLALPDLRKYRQDRTRREWLRALPDDVVRRRPLLAAFLAWTRLSEGDLDGAQAWLDDAERAREIVRPEAMTNLP